MIKYTKHFFWSTFLVIMILGCDPLTKSEIINNCTSDIKIVLHFDKELLDSTWYGTQSYVDYLEEFGNLHDKRVSFDTSNLIISYMLSPNDTLLVHGAIGTRPNFIFNQIEVIKDTDTLNFLDYDMIYSKFKNTEYYLFEFKIMDNLFKQ